ncbi:MAG: hypothetical protein ABSE42_14850 [Bryobacteraceae bacterium]
MKPESVSSVPVPFTRKRDFPGSAGPLPAITQVQNNWTNQNSLGVIDRAPGFQLTWTGGDAGEHGGVHRSVVGVTDSAGRCGDVDG